jgi:hypothetical protein
MKKLILFLIMFALTFAMFAQDRTLSTRKVPSKDTYVSYTGVAADTLTTNQDSIRFPYFINKSYPMSWVINTTFDTINGGNATVVINVYGKVFSDDSWTKIQTETTGLIIASEIVKTTFTESTVTIASTYTDTYDATYIDTLVGSVTTGATTGLTTVGVVAGTTTAVASSTFYRYYMVEYIIQGENDAGEGISIEKVEWKWWFRDY